MCKVGKHAASNSRACIFAAICCNVWSCRGHAFGSGSNSVGHDGQVEAEYGRMMLTAEQGSSKLVITAQAPHRSFDLLALPTTQGFHDEGIQTFSGTATVEAFEHDTVVDNQTISGVNLQFGSAYAERTVQRMTAQQFSSPLRYKGKGVTR